ncbi:hypothetical protein K435DRAFT_808370 [Dendrothele bispora CBS 962.96]|uniref:Uncharacterized protein n=1 Tax=Dendrothele bispora (strain CBS 962.96) TaxID=1314807 RepID=A0A4S8L1W0_DENBC|nr:hypothetical protein K435DRAFT_808370 [Dendrothele bispora CBS 962.96]
MAPIAFGIKKKRRIQNACDELIFVSSLTAKGSATAPLKELIDEMLKGTSSESSIAWADNETTISIITELAKRIRQLESKLKWCQENHNEVLSEDLSLPAQAESDPLNSVDDVNQLTQEIAQFTLGPPDKPTHFGESSNMMLIVTAMDHRKEADSSLPEWQSLLQNGKRQEDEPEQIMSAILLDSELLRDNNENDGFDSVHIEGEAFLPAHETEDWLREAGFLVRKELLDIVCPVELY